MSQYGVGTENPFDALDEEGPKKAAKAAAPEAKVAPAAQKAPEQTRTLDASTKRGGFRGGRGGRGARGGRGGFRGGRGGFGNREPRRQFERHSGTGRGKEIRKGGYGGYDAEGTMQDDMKAEEVAKQLTLEDAKPADAAATGAVAVPAAPAAAPVPETEEEKKAREEAEKEAAREASLLTYDQFVEQQKKKAVEADSKLQVRAVEIDDKKFKSCKALEKNDDDGYADILGTAEEEKDENKKKGEKKAKKTKHLDEVLKELPGGAPQAHASEFHGGRGGFRGGRGGFRGVPRGGFRGRGGRGGHGPAAPVVVDVKSDAEFPKLGK